MEETQPGSKLKTSQALYHPGIFHKYCNMEAGQQDKGKRDGPKTARENSEEQGFLVTSG